MNQNKIPAIIDDTSTSLRSAYSSNAIENIKENIENIIPTVINDSTITTTNANSSSKFESIAADIRSRISRYNENYSSSELFTGYYWIDGRPIYRKTYTGLRIGSTGGAWTNINVSLPSGMVNIINTYVFHVSSNNYRDSKGAGISIALLNGVLKYWTESAWSTNVPNCLVLEYTK